MYSLIHLNIKYLIFINGYIKNLLEIQEYRKSKILELYPHFNNESDLLLAQSPINTRASIQNNINIRQPTYSPIKSPIDNISNTQTSVYANFHLPTYSPIKSTINNTLRIDNKISNI